MSHLDPSLLQGLDLRPVLRRGDDRRPGASTMMDMAVQSLAWWPAVRAVVKLEPETGFKEWILVPTLAPIPSCFAVPLLDAPCRLPPTAAIVEIMSFVLNLSLRNHYSNTRICARGCPARQDHGFEVDSPNGEERPTDISVHQEEASVGEGISC